MRSKIIGRLPAVVLLISIFFSGISLIPDSGSVPGFDWATYDRTSSVGPLDYTLKADFDAVGFQYSLGTSSSSSGGGIIGGIGGGAGSNITRKEEWKSYPQVRGDVLENLGIIYDSYKEKSYIYELLFRNPPDPEITYNGSGSPSAYLNVSLSADLVPYWPEGSSRNLKVDVTFLGTDLEDQVSADLKERFLITLEKITIKARTGMDPDTGEYEGETEVIAQKELSETFRTKEETYSTSFDVEVPEGEEAVGFIVEIDASMNDYWDRGERSPLSGSANPINIRSIESFKITRGLGIPLALPILFISIIVGFAGSIIVLISGRSLWGVFVPSALLSTLGPLWFWIGMNAATDILGERLSGAEEGLSWEIGFFLAIAGSVLAITSLVFSIVSRKIGRKEEGAGKEDAKDVTTPYRPIDKADNATSPPTFRRIEEGSRENQNRPPPPPVDPLS